MGEGFGVADKDIMPYIDMTNIACGFHAGDPHIMDKTVALAAEHNVMIGAHPGYPDLAGFGRRELNFSPDEIINLVLYQVGALRAICARHNTRLSYIKPHGALYNAIMLDVNVYKAILKAISIFDAKTPLMIMFMPNHRQYSDIAQSVGVKLLFEAFCDRMYTDSGHLQSREEVGAIHNSLELICEQAQNIIFNQKVKTNSGKSLSIQADTICIHGDAELALSSVKNIRNLLTA